MLVSEREFCGTETAWRVNRPHWSVVSLLAVTLGAVNTGGIQPAAQLHRLEDEGE